MQVPKNILEKQLCSQCQKYLSVGPVKVYPNREVRCGRCSKDNDHGVESLLYLTVMKDMLFPCINCLEGCEEQIALSEMKQHEEDCKGSKYNCPICGTFEGETHLLSKHCETYHKKQRLQMMAYHIDLAKGNQHCCYFYIKDSVFLFVESTYEEQLQKIVIDVLLPADKYKGGILQVLTISSVEDKTIFKTAEVPCSKLNSTERYPVTIHMSNLKLPSRIAYCKVDLITNLQMNRKILFVDPTSDSFIARCKFKNISKIGLLNHYFPAVYYFCDISWRVYISRQSNMYIYLQWSDAEASLVCSAEVTFTLLSPDNLTKSRLLSIRKVNCIKQNVTGWNLENCIKNDEITIDVKIRIYSQDNKKTM